MASEWRDKKELNTPKFSELVNRFCYVKLLRKDDDNIDVNVIIDQLNALRIDPAAVAEKVGRLKELYLL